MPVSTHLFKNASVLKYLEEAESLTHLIVHLGVHECIDHIHTYRYTDEMFSTCLFSACFTQSKNPCTLFLCKTGFPFLESPWQPSPMPASGLIQPIWTLVTRGMCGISSGVSTGEEEAWLPFLSNHCLIHPWGCDCLFHSWSHPWCLYCQSVVDESIHDVLFFHDQLPLEVIAAHLPVCVCTNGWGLCH